MINRKHRFHGHNSLNSVYRIGKTIRTEYVSLRFGPSKRGDYRLAVVVSRKTNKSAVTRNRIRRRIYEIVRLKHRADGQAWPYDMIISVFDDRLASMETGELQELIHKLLNKAAISGENAPMHARVGGKER